MVRLAVVVLLLGTAAAAAEAPTQRQKTACGAFSEASEGMATSIEKQRQAYAKTQFGSLASDLPPEAAQAARNAQQAQEEADQALRVLKERVEDLSYRLKLCGRG